MQAASSLLPRPCGRSPASPANRTRLPCAKPAARSADCCAKSGVGVSALAAPAPAKRPAPEDTDGPAVQPDTRPVPRFLRPSASREPARPSPAEPGDPREELLRRMQRAWSLQSPSTTDLSRLKTDVTSLDVPDPAQILSDRTRTTVGAESRDTVRTEAQVCELGGWWPANPVAPGPSASPVLVPRHNPTPRRRPDRTDDILLLL